MYKKKKPIILKNLPLYFPSSHSFSFFTISPIGDDLKKIKFIIKLEVKTEKSLENLLYKKKETQKLSHFTVV
jgi:hypothetical protein